MNRGLSAEVNTQYGKTRKIAMETGRQGSRVTGRMFSKTMDLLSEDIMEKNEGIPLTNDFTIGALLWMDDVITCVTGEENQKKMLQKANTFAKNHKMKWGQKKCKVMKIGKPTDTKE